MANDLNSFGEINLEGDALKNLQYKMLIGVDRVIETLKDPHHQEILRNYRVHVALEQAGRWDEFLHNDAFMVDEPRYQFRFKNESTVCVGRDQVNELYKGAAPFSEVQIGERLAVGDWGLASWSDRYTFEKGQFFIDQGVEMDDPEADYLEITQMAMFWRYTEDVRLIGEEVNEIQAPVYHKLRPDQVYTKKQLIADCNRYLFEIGYDKELVA